MNLEPVSQAMIDTLEHRCPILGHLVEFHYCRHSGKDHHPCHKVIDCWWEQFDVKSHLTKTLEPESLKAITSSHPKTKVSTLLEIVKAVKSSTGDH